MDILVGDYVIIEWIENITKVQGDIVHILYADQIKHLRQSDLWYVNPDAVERHVWPLHHLPSCVCFSLSSMLWCVIPSQLYYYQCCSCHIFA